MDNLTLDQSKQISHVYHMIGADLMSIAFDRPVGFEMFEFSFAKLNDTVEEFDRDIKGWSRISFALNRWRGEKRNFNYDEIEAKLILNWLILLSAGRKMDEKYAKVEEQLLEYLEHPVGE